jgi:hypothetical protein
MTWVLRLLEKLITEPYPYFSIKAGLSVEPPKSDILSGVEATNIIFFLWLPRD